MEIVVPEEFEYLYEQNATRPIVKIPSPVLRAVALEVTKLDKATLKFINQMVKEMDKANGIGLAAPQLGVSKRIIVISPGESKPIALINPVITETSGEEVGQEGCLSIPGLYGDVLRFASITVEAHDINGKPVAYDMSGLSARVIQHEVDHLEGKLFIDTVDVATLHWMHPHEGDED